MVQKRKSKRFSIWDGNTRKFDGKTYKFFAGYGKEGAKRKAAELRKMGFQCRIVRHLAEESHIQYRYDVYTRKR